MAFIRDWATTETTVVALGTTGSMPRHEVNDLLLWIISKDSNTGGELGTSSPGWMVLDRQTGNAALASAIMWKFASSSNEEAPLASGTNANAFHSVMLSIPDANLTSPFNISSSTANVAAANFSAAAVTTTQDDCLIIWAVSSDGTITSALSNPGAQHLVSRDSGIISTAVSWGFQHTAGSTFSPTWVQSINEETNRYTLAINNITNGRIPAYADRSINPATMASPLHHISNINGLVFTASLDIPFIGNKSTAADTVTSLADFGINSYSNAIANTPATTLSSSQAGFKIAFQFNAIAVSGTFACSFGCGSPRNAFTDVGTILETGSLFTVVDGHYANSSYRSYQFAAADSKPGWFGRDLFAININQTTTAEAFSGSLNTSAILGVLFTTSCPRGATTLFHSELHLIDKLAIAGGTFNFPIDIDGVEIVGNGYRLPVVRHIDPSTLLAYTPIQFGGWDPLHLRLENCTVQFPEIFNKQTKHLSYHANPLEIGLIYRAASGSVIRHINSLVTSPSEYYWQIHSLSSPSATYDFSGLTIANAAVQLYDVTTFEKMNFVDCTRITASDCTLVDCTISKVPPSGSAFLITTESVIRECTIDVSHVSASLAWCNNVQNPGVFTSCSFIGSSSAGHALRFTTPGSYTFIRNTFTNFGTSGTVNAAIFNDSGGLITLNVTGAVPSYYDGVGALTIINTASSDCVCTASVLSGSFLDSDRALLQHVFSVLNQYSTASVGLITTGVWTAPNATFNTTGTMGHLENSIASRAITGDSMSLTLATRGLIISGVWDERVNLHTTSGSTGDTLYSASNFVIVTTPSTVDAIVSGVWNATARTFNTSGTTGWQENRINIMSSSIDAIRGIEFGRWEITGSQQIFYNEAGTEIRRFNLLTADGSPFYHDDDAVVEREPTGSV